MRVSITTRSPAAAGGGLTGLGLVLRYSPCGGAASASACAGPAWSLPPLAADLTGSIEMFWKMGVAVGGCQGLRSLAAGVVGDRAGRRWRWCCCGVRPAATAWSQRGRDKQAAEPGSGVTGRRRPTTAAGQLPPGRPPHRPRREPRQGAGASRARARRPKTMMTTRRRRGYLASARYDLTADAVGPTMPLASPDPRGDFASLSGIAGGYFRLSSNSAEICAESCLACRQLL